MSDSNAPQDGSTETRLIEGRSCGGCDVCCVTPTVDDPELKNSRAIAAPI